MDQQALQRMKSGEESWWYRGRRRIISSALRAVHTSPTDSVLDFGAGYGAMRPILSTFGAHVYAFEPVPDVVAHVQAEGYEAVFETESEALSRQYGLVGIFDVLEHIEADGSQLQRIHTAISQQGTLVVTVPASMLLWSGHDVQNQHYRRYSRRTLRSVVEKAGFEVMFVNYWNTILYPLALIARVTGNSGESSFSMPRIIDNLFYACIIVESVLMRWIPLPFGVSLVLVAKKV